MAHGTGMSIRSTAVVVSPITVVSAIPYFPKSESPKPILYETHIPPPLLHLNGAPARGLPARQSSCTQP